MSIEHLQACSLIDRSPTAGYRSSPRSAAAYAGLVGKLRGRTVP